jgi:hypothetical protein
VPVNTSGTLVAGLTFSDYPVSGKAGMVSGLGNSRQSLIGASRRFGVAVKAGDTLWISFLFTQNAKDVVWVQNAVRTGTNPTGGTLQINIQPRVTTEWATSPAPSGIDGAASPLWPNNADTTYLCVAEVTHLGGAGTETLWILNAANYDAIKAGGIAREKLAANNVATATKASANITLDASRYLQLGCAHWGEGTTCLTVDEVKFATTLPEVLAPVKTPGVTPVKPTQPVKPAPAPKPVPTTSDLNGKPIPPDFEYPAGFHSNLTFVGGKAGWSMDAEGLHGSRDLSSFHKAWETAAEPARGSAPNNQKK